MTLVEFIYRVLVSSLKFIYLVLVTSVDLSS